MPIYGTVISRQGTISFLKNRSKRVEVCLCRAIFGKLFVGQKLINWLQVEEFWLVYRQVMLPLFGFRSCNSLATPSVVMMMPDIGGMFVVGYCGK